MSHSTKVLELNSKAVSFLLQGNHDGSHWTLQSALEGFRTALNHHEQENANVAGTKRRLSLRQDEENMMMMDDTILHTVPVGVSSSVAFCESVITVYNRAFVLQNENGSFDASLFSEDSQHTVPACILYNMGLSHHMQALQTGRSAILKKALQLYTMSFSMLEQASDCLGEIDIMILLALSNNMGAISYQLYDQQGAQTSRDMIERVLTSSDCIEAMDDKDLEFFSLNLMFFSDPQMNRLAPAA